jgi:mannose-6-phosphate isomerase-like protein (cupin superfamily)
MKVNFYDEDDAYFTSRELKTGDVILLASGGHGFEFLEETELIEVKQGPYAGDKDKERFNGVKK